VEPIGGIEQKNDQNPFEYEETKKTMASRVFERSLGYNQEKCGCQDEEQQPKYQGHAEILSPINALIF